MILYLISELDVGGAEKNLYHLATGVAQRYGERFASPTVACLWGSGPVGEWLEREGVSVVRLCPSGRNLPAALLRLRRLLKTGRFAILHTFLFHANLVGRLAAIRTGVPVISSIRVTEVDRTYRVFLDRMTNGLVAAETCVADAVRDWSIARGLPANKLLTIPNAVDPASFKGTGGRLRAELGLDDNARIVAFVGRLHGQKGVDVLMEAAGTLCADRPNLHFVLAGSGPLADSVRQAAERLNVADQVHLLGQRDDVPDILADADMLVLPSRWEGMPNAALDAMAAGKPVIAANVGGAGEVVIDDVTGLLIPPESPQELAEAVEHLLDDPAEAARMGLAGRNRARKDFSVDAMIDKNVELYEVVMHEQGVIHRKQ